MMLIFVSNPMGQASCTDQSLPISVTIKRRRRPMFCLCCRSPGGFFAEGVAEPVLDFARALKRRTAYERRTQYSGAPAVHPVQSEFVVRQTRAITMDPHIGELTKADIHVRDGAIVNIGRALATSALEIDGTDLIVLPGLIADHRHLVSEITPSADPHGTSLRGAAPQDIYRALRLALLDLVSAGFTCIHVCGADVGSDHAETAVLAQIDSGARGRFSYPLDAQAAHDMKKAVRELYETWFAEPAEHLLDLGITGDDINLEQLLAPHRLPLASTHSSGPNKESDAAGRTIGAARTLEFDQWIGSLSPGKRADLILVRSTAQPANSKTLRHFTTDDVEMVCIDGRIRKRNGVLTEPNEGLIRHEGLEAIARLVAVQ
jgi:cytosine/adenosine deaminase-related metal-dependent hydrolase